MGRFAYSFRFLRRRRRKGASPPGPPAPFVVGLGRSGTTVLRLMLDAHPALTIPPETHFVSPLIQASGSLRFDADRAAQLIIDGRHRRWPDFGLDADELRARLHAIPDFNTSDALRVFYRLYAEKQGKPRWGDKTPDYVRKMMKIQLALPEARFIHLIRDGRDAGLSHNARIVSRGVRKPLPAAELARRWVVRIRKARELASRLTGYLELRYEDLVTDPEPALREVCDLIELDYDPAMLDYHRHAEERLREMAGELPAIAGRPAREAGERLAAHAMATKPPSRERIARWKQEMSREDLAEFEATAGDLLAELGYETLSGRTAPGAQRSQT
jgi:Sulfotransferase family